MTDLLDEDRMTRMRSNVLGTVQEKSRQRGKRIRTRLGFASAAAAILVIGTVGMSVIPTHSDDMDSTSMADSKSVSRDGDISTAYAGSADFAAAEDSAGGTELNSTASIIEEAQAREVIVTGSASLEVKDPRGAAAKLTAWVEGHGGRLDSRNFYQDNGSEFATVTLRVPASKVSETLTKLESYGEVSNVSISNDDVTSAARDLDARIDALTISIDRLQDILRKATSSREVVAAEQALTDRQSQLEQLKSERKQISEQVALATLTVEMSSHEKTSTVDPGGFRGGLKDGWNSLVDMVNRIVEGTGVLLPWLGALVALYGGYRLIRGAVRRRGVRQ